MTATGGNYASLAAIRRHGVDVRVEDSETAGLVVEPASLTIAEGGTAEYRVRLSAPPASGTTTVTAAATGAAGLTLSASALLFDAATWDAAQTVTVTAVADHDRLTDAEGRLTHAAADYGAVAAGPDVRVTVRNTTVDHDADADGLIDIDSLAKLNAMRWDLDGDGTSATTTYAAAFPNPRGGAVCPTAVSGVACVGFELATDLDFDTDGDGRTWTMSGGVVGGDEEDDYYNGGLGWTPIGATAATPFAAVFVGNGRIVRNLFVNAGGVNYRGLFGVASGRLEARGRGRRLGARRPRCGSAGRLRQRRRPGDGELEHGVGVGRPGRWRPGGADPDRHAHRGELLDGGGGVPRRGRPAPRAAWPAAAAARRPWRRAGRPARWRAPARTRPA